MTKQVASRPSLLYEQQITMTSAADTDATARPRSSSLSRSRPTTPLRRISASSLRSLSLSHSRSRAPTSTEPPLQHLSQLFAELADSVTDLTQKFQDLAAINTDLDAFNHAFASYLYGLRINAYTADFEEVRVMSLVKTACAD